MKAISAILLLATFAFVSCKANTITSDKRITKGGWLAMHASIGEVSESRVNGDLLNVSVEIESNASSDSRFNYKFVFFDKEGRKLFSPTSGFKQEQIPAGAFMTISGQATDPRATTFRLTLTNAN
jgi:uncharacterized protein YcfL